jgi:hypothetical protein
MGTLLSLPESNLPMFFWWVIITSKATAMAKMRYAILSTLKTIKINTGKAKLANIELRETNLVR